MRITLLMLMDYAYFVIRERARDLSIGGVLEFYLKAEEVVEGLGVFDGLLHLFVPLSYRFPLLKLG
jgi:hypothetical protein